jgi:iron complex outermembrane receptor protein
VNTQSFHGLFENEPMPIPPDAGDTSTLFDLTATTYAVFTQETVEFVPRAHVTVGARINRDIKDYSYLVDFTQTGMAQVPLSHASATWDSFTPKVGLDWRPVDPLMVYASYANGFKSGGFGPSNNAMVPTPKYDPEKVTAYELGVKTDWLPRHRLTLNVAGFYNDYRDIQLTVQRVDPVTNANIRTTQNAGGSHIKGFEVEVGAIPVHALALNLGVGYVDARFSSLSAAATTGPPGAPVFHLGDNLPQIPTWSVNGGAQYAFEMDPGELTLRGDIIYKSEQFLTAVDPTSRQEGYFLYNARISFIPAGAKSLELSIYGLNLADKVYYIYHATLPPTGQEVAIPAAPRTIYAQARYLL